MDYIILILLERITTLQQIEFMHTCLRFTINLILLLPALCFSKVKMFLRIVMKVLLKYQAIKVAQMYITIFACIEKETIQLTHKLDWELDTKIWIQVVLILLLLL
jgi:hypothetical protein